MKDLSVCLLGRERHKTIINTLDNLKVKAVMTRNPITIDKDVLAAKALSLMNSKRITSLCVHRNKKIKKTLGLIHMHDILRSNIN